MQNNIDQELAAVQEHCLLMLQEIDRVCRKNDIKYSLTGGSVIGYHLYGGFIPWDDDIDLMMTRDHYERFLEAWQREPEQKYAIHNFENKKNKHMMFSKIVDERTTVVENFEGYAETVGGVFVDITVFDKLPRDKKERKKFECLSWFVQQARERVIQWKVDSSIKSTLCRFAKNIVFCILRWFDEPIYKYVKNKFVNVDAEEYDLAELMAGIKIPYNTKLFDHYIDIEFGGGNCMIVRDYLDYLETRYGRREFYKEKRSGDSPHHYLYVNLNLPFTQYLKQTASKLP